MKNTPRSDTSLDTVIASGSPVLNPLNQPDTPEAPQLLIEIPPDFQAMRTADPELALAWRLHSRQIFQHYFERAYLVTNFIYEPGEQPRSFYVLTTADD